MTTFHESVHCLSGSHCRTCRDQTDGRPWRASIARSLQGVSRVDFECPKGLPWGNLTDAPEPPIGEPIPVLTFEAVRKRILDAPDGGVWADLKYELRLVESALELHASKAPCWKARQRQRLVIQYHVARSRNSA